MASFPWHDWRRLADQLAVAKAAAAAAEAELARLAGRHGCRYTAKRLGVAPPTVGRWSSGALASERLAGIEAQAAAVAENFGHPLGR